MVDCSVSCLSNLYTGFVMFNWRLIKYYGCVFEIIYSLHRCNVIHESRE